MSVLAGIVKNILVIIILTSFLEILLPEGRLKPFVRFTVGLFILISVLNPALTFIFKNQEVKVSMWDYTEKYIDNREILAKGNNLNEEIRKQSSTVVGEKIQGQISAVALMLPEVEDVTTRAYISDEGRLEKVHIIVRSRKGEAEEKARAGVFAGQHNGRKDKADEEVVKKKITSIIQNLYGLAEDYIQIEFEGGS
ncbi:stage III sporulation protein AF [Thermosyntropha lipolytica DSM 11003]|uniref:Stage III sporulation protein AF n=1 Tax=Thermosyntropha lipolytica DSM 11003 TaxID=1123382 RepID=A0A1M5LJD3_9FIRM|nr:stage III sporulation protein AF [Thermosyntropha lipolytica]SHG65222.1 stage III sporulation protein AF [Thermosyntropha lipolytica DSM 11003]